MAKLRGIVSAAISGKSGGVVFAKGLKGETIMRPYQPMVKNPKTARQQECRERMKTASGLAALMAQVLNIGYAKAASSLRIYPRNLFVRDMVKHGITPIAIEGGEAEIDWPSVKVSKRDGLYESVMFTGTSAEGSHAIVVRPAAVPDAGELTDGVMGVVVCAVNQTENICVVQTATASTAQSSGVTLTFDASQTGLELDVFAFFKWIPNGLTDIQSSEYPWKYPSPTGGTHYVAKVTLG